MLALFKVTMSNASSNTKPLRVIFAGTPDFAAMALDALIKNKDNVDVEVIAAYTQPDRPAGRGRQLKASPVKELAVKHSIAVHQPLNFKQQDDLDILSQLKPDLMIVAAYGIILPAEVLTIPTLGCINIHASLLPRWRGAAPIQRAIITGDTQTGITIMQMDEVLDTGDMMLKTNCDIAATDTGSSLHDKLAELGANTMLEAIKCIQQGNPPLIKQDNNQACYAHKLSKEEALIDWQQSAEQIHRQIRAFNSWPVAQTHFEKKIIRLWQANVSDTSSTNTIGEILEITKNEIIVSCGQGRLAITDLQLSGAKRMSVNALLNGRPDFFKVGQIFS